MKSKIIGTLVLVLALILLPVSPALADTSAQVTVTATPGVVSITNAPSSWAINRIGGGTATISTNTTYYANPSGNTTQPGGAVAAGDCLFTANNTSNIPVDLTVNFTNFIGSGDTMTNSNDGTNTAATFGAWSYHSGMTYASKVVAKTTGSDAMKTNLSATTTLKWGLEILTRTDAWTLSDSMSANVTITATQS